MPTIRSHFSFKQFERVFQKLAHEIAVDAVTNMNKGRVRINISGNRLSEVSINSGSLAIKFYAKHLTYSHSPEEAWDEWWGFDIEEKLYLTSNHSTKISFYAPEGKEKERAEKITKFIDKIMAEVKIIPRFSLRDLPQSE